MRKNRQAIAVGIISLLCAVPIMAANPANPEGTPDPGGPGFPGSNRQDTQSTPHNRKSEIKDARQTVADAAKVVQQLKSNPDTRDTLSHAKAVFIVPNYTRAALGIGGAGGEGVLVANNNGNWSAPAFYNVGTVNLGLEAGVEHGQIAFFIMSDKALQEFRDKNNFSLNADAGLSIINWSARAQASAGKGADVIAWSNTKGLYGDLAVSVTDIYWDKQANRAYYGQNVAANDIFTGKVRDPMANSPLEAEFAALESGNPNGNNPGNPDDTNP